MEVPIPFVEILDCCSDKSSVNDALQKISTHRNDDGHVKRPKGHEIPSAIEKAMLDLETLLRGIECISEYSLRYIEDARRDTLLGITHYTYRDLMGDHPLTPIEKGTTNKELEKGSLYLGDRDKQLYLLRPFLIRQECPKCHRASIFYVDKYNKDKSVIFKSMEHGHTIEDSQVTETFHQLGFLI